MKNYGLSNYAALVKRALTDVANIYLNVSYETNNAHVEIPLYKSKYKRPLNLSLIYNHQDRNNNYDIAKGVKTNFDIRLVKENENYLVIYPTGQKFVLYKNNDVYFNLYENQEVNLQLIIDQDIHYLNCKNTFTCIFKKMDTYYIVENIEFKDKSEYTLTYDSSNRLHKIENNAFKKEVITINYASDSYILIEVEKTNINNELKHVKVIRIYKNEEGSYSNYLNRVTVSPKPGSNNKIKDISFEYQANENGIQTYTIIDNLKNLSCQYCMNMMNLLTSFKDEFNKVTTFSIQNMCESTITDYKGKTVKIYVDLDSKVINVVDIFKQKIKSITYDENKKIISESKELSLNPIYNGKRFECSNIYGTLIQTNDVDVPLQLSSYYESGRCKNIVGPGEAEARYVFETNGKMLDVYSFAVWAKIKSVQNPLDSCLVDIYFTDDINNFKNNDKLAKQLKIEYKELSGYEYHISSAKALKNHKYVVVVIKYQGQRVDANFIVDLYKESLSTVVEYDNNGNPITILSGQETRNNAYNDDCSVAFDNHYNYQYNENGKVTKINLSPDKFETLNYDDQNNLLSSQVSDGQLVMGESNTYIDKEVVSKNTSNILNINDFGYYDEYHTKIERNYREENGFLSTEVQLEYKEDEYEVVEKKDYYSITKEGELTEDLQLIISERYEKIGSLIYEYDNCNMLSKVINGNFTYEIVYDNYKRIVGHKINGILFLSRQYKIDSQYNVDTNLVSKDNYGSKDCYEYEYDQLDRLISITYKDNINNQTNVLYQYEYNQFDRIVKVICVETNRQYLFEYNINGNLISYSDGDFKQKNVFNNENKLLVKEFEIEDKLLSIDNQIINKANYKEYTNYKANIRNNTDLLLCMFDDISLKYKENENENVYTPIKLVNTKNKQVINAVDFLSMDENVVKLNLLNAYKIDHLHTIAFPTGNFKSVSFAYKNSDNQPLIFRLVYFVNNEAKHININLYNTSSNIDWNFVTINVYKELNKIEVIKNSSTSTQTINFDSVDITSFGFIKVTECLITNIILSNDYVDDTLFTKLYDSFRYLTVLEEGVYGEGEIVRKSISSCKEEELDSNGNVLRPYNVISLTKSTTGVDIDNNLIEPTIHTLVSNFTFASRDSEFIYNNVLEKYVYYAMGQKLAYDSLLSNSGTISLNASRMYVDSKNILLDLINSDDKHITLSFSNDKIELNFLDSTYFSESNNSFKETNKWNVITLKWTKLITSSSIDTIFYNVKVFFNNNVIINKEIESLYDINKEFTMHLGRLDDDTTNYGYFFNGLIENVIFTDEYVEDNETENIISFITNKDGIIHEYNSFDLLTNTKVINDSNEILNNAYTYNTTSNVLTPQVKIETINNDVYQYEYDVRGNVKTIEKNDVILHQYSYDGLGRLSSSNNEKYIYDSNGNITSVTDLEGNVLHTYSYDENNRNLLVSFDGNAITYDSGNTYNPISIGNDKILTYKCNKLKTFRDTTKLFYNVYDYDSSGNRIKKVRYNGSGTALETIKYYYDDSGKLIYQKVDSYISSITHNESLIFMYDELGKLYGFIYNNEKYYYIKNIFNTILGIVDSTGNVVVQYNYDTWGNIISVEDNSTDLIGSINPFKYKGYYYDSDIEMYYCKVRYYYPKIKRFIEPADVSSFNPSNINGLNLYAYASNNPIGIVVTGSYNYNTASNYMQVTSDFFKVQTITTDKEVKYGFQGFYKGVPVFVIPDSDLLSSFSFGAIFLEKSKVGDSEVLNHEWGHTRQMLLLGVGDFFNMIGLPSIITNLIDRDYDVDYFNKPWEITADMFGGVNRSQHSKETKALGIAYLACAELLSNVVVKPIMLQVYAPVAALMDSVIPGLGTTLLAIMYTS